MINARFVKPLDRSWLLENLKGIQTIVTVEENVLAGGFGSAVQEVLEGNPFRIKRLGIPDTFVEHGTQPILRRLVGLSDEKIAEFVKTAHLETSLH